MLFSHSVNESVQAGAKNATFCLFQIHFDSSKILLMFDSYIRARLNLKDSLFSGFVLE